MICRSNKLSPPDPAPAARSWLASAIYRVLHYEPCGAPATHLAYQNMPMCSDHAEKFRISLRSADCAMNLAIGRGRTEAEIDDLVRPISTGS